MALILTYEDLKKRAAGGGGFNVVAVDLPITTETTGSSLGGAPVPQLPVVQFPMEDLTYSSDFTATLNDVNKLLSIRPGTTAPVNNFKGSQLIFSSDRVVVNSRTDYLMLFGGAGVSIASPNPVNIDSDSSCTIFAEDNLYLGVPNRGEEYDFDGQKAPTNKGQPTVNQEYEPLVLGYKLVNLIEDLIVAIKNATVLTPTGNGYFSEAVMTELAQLQSRLPEMLSTYAFIDGVSHESVDSAPQDPKKTPQKPESNVVGTVSGQLDGVSDINSNKEIGSDTIQSNLKDKPDFFNPL